MMKKIIHLLFTGFSALSFSSLALATNFTVANTTQADTPMSKTMIAFQERVQTLSANKITVQTSFGGALGNDTQLLQKTQIGSQIQAAQTSGANLGTVVNAFKIFDVPFLLEGPEQSIKLLYPDNKLSGEIVDKLQEFLAKKNLRLLYATPFEYRGVLTSNKVVHTAEDVKGMKFRVTPNPVERAIVESWGGTGTTMSISEVYTSLQTGIVDGLAIPPATAKSFALNEVAKGFNNVNFQAHPTFVVINKKLWDRLPDDEKKIIQQAADEAVIETKQLHYDAVSDALDSFQKSGSVVIQPDENELASFRTLAINAGEKIIVSELKDDEKNLLDLLKKSATQ